MVYTTYMWWFWGGLIIGLQHYFVVQHVITSLYMKKTDCQIAVANDEIVAAGVSRD